MKILANDTPDLIHLQNHIFDMVIFATLMARRLKRPLVITVHTMLRHSHKIYDLILRIADRFLLKPLIIRFAQLLICPDKTIYDYVAKTYGDVISSLIPYGIEEIPKPRVDKMLEVRKIYQLEEGHVILSLGHLHEVRNRKELVQLLPRLIHKFPNIKILIVGDIGTRSTEKLAIDLGVRDHVIFTGPIPHNDLPEYFGIADIEAHWFHRNHPNRALGIAALEAMSAGKVVFAAADENVYGEGVLKDRRNIMLVHPEDLEDLIKRMVDVLVDESQRHEIGKQARQTIQNNFSWDIVSEQTLKAYKSVLSKTSVEGFH